MLFLVPAALGGFVTTLGLGLKRVLEELAPPAFPEGSPAREAWARHQEAVKRLRASRQRVKERARAYSERQALVLRETVEPFRAPRAKRSPGAARCPHGGLSPASETGQAYEGSPPVTL